MIANVSVTLIARRLPAVPSNESSASWPGFDIATLTAAPPGTIERARSTALLTVIDPCPRTTAVYVPPIRSTLSFTVADSFESVGLDGTAHSAGLYVWDGSQWNGNTPQASEATLVATETDWCPGRVEGCLVRAEVTGHPKRQFSSGCKT